MAHLPTHSPRWVSIPPSHYSGNQALSDELPNCIKQQVNAVKLILLRGQCNLLYQYESMI